MAIDELQRKIRKLKNPSMVGLAPAPALLPPPVYEKAVSSYGQSVRALAAAYEEFCGGVLQALQGLVPAVALQAACFHALGSDGTAVLQTLLQQAQKLGFYVLLDADFGGTGTAAEQCAASVFGAEDPAFPAPYACDAFALNAYAGSDAVQPFLPGCSRGKNLFIHVRTPNKSAREVQDLISGDRVVHGAMADLVVRWGSELTGSCGYSEIAGIAGVGAGEALAVLRRKYDRLFLLVAGYGEQSGAAKIASQAFDRLGHGAIVRAGSSVFAAWQKTGDAAEYAAAARTAAQKMRDDLSKFVTVM